MRVLGGDEGKGTKSLSAIKGSQYIMPKLKIMVVIRRRKKRRRREYHKHVT